MLLVKHGRQKEVGLLLEIGNLEITRISKLGQLFFLILMMISWMSIDFIVF